MALTQYLRSVKVPIPKELRGLEDLQGGDFLRFGTTYERLGRGEPFVGRIGIYLVPRGGSGFSCDKFSLLHEMPLRLEDAAEYSRRARARAADSRALVWMLASSKPAI